MTTQHNDDTLQFDTLLLKISLVMFHQLTITGLSLLAQLFLKYSIIVYCFSLKNPVQKTTPTKDHPDKRPPSWFFYGEILSHLIVYSFIREQVKVTKMTKMAKMTLSVFVSVV